MQYLINGLITGSLYALVAAGFSLIYSTNRFVHFAHGSVITFGAYALLLTFSWLAMPLWLAIPIALLSSMLLGMAMHILMYRPLQRKGASSAILLIASIGLMLLTDNLLQVIFGTEGYVLDGIPVMEGMEFFGASITPYHLLALAVTVLLLVMLWFFTTRTSLGIKMRAVADHPELADLTGINHERIWLLSFVVGSFLAGVAGILIALILSIEPLMGTNMMVKGFTGAVIGGITSLPGSILGGLIVGLLENLGTIVISSGFKDAIAFVLLFIFLLVKPTGLFGLNKGVRS